MGKGGAGMAKRRTRKAKKFTYGGRRIDHPEKIGAGANFLGTCMMWGTLSPCTLGYVVVVVGAVVGFLFGGGYIFSKLDWI